MTVENMTAVGWSAVKVATGPLKKYKSGGMTIDTGSLKPRYVVSVMIPGGFTGDFDVATKKLTVYKGGSEASAEDLSDTEYTIFMMV